MYQLGRTISDEDTSIYELFIKRLSRRLQCRQETFDIKVQAGGVQAAAQRLLEPEEALTAAEDSRQNQLVIDVDLPDVLLRSEGQRADLLFSYLGQFGDIVCFDPYLIDRIVR